MVHNRSTLFLLQGAVIAAVYAALTYAAGLIGLGFGPIQLRLSEALTILPVFTPAAIPGLTVGCLLGNLASPYGVIDLLCGTLATCLAACATYLLRSVRVRGIPLLAPLPAVVFNALIVGAELAFFLPAGGGWAGFALAALQVGAGQMIVCYGLGFPLYRLVQKTPPLYNFLHAN